MPRVLSRRSFACASAGAVLAFPALSNLRSLSSVLAQEGDLASLGLPEIAVTITETGFEGAPTELTAGRYLLTASYADGVEAGAAAFVTSADFTTEPVIAVVQAEAGAASPAAEEESGPIPDEVYSWHFAGGASPTPAGPAHAVVDLQAGNWLLWGDDPTLPLAPVEISVTGEWPTDLAEPVSDITVTFADYSIAIDGALTPGDHLLKLVDDGAEPHFVFVAKVADGTTDKQWGDFFMSSMGMAATPGPEGAFDPSSMVPVGATATQSAGVTQWAPMSFEAGTYGAVCFFPTMGTGAPHVMMGMHKIFTIA